MSDYTIHRITRQQLCNSKQKSCYVSTDMEYNDTDITDLPQFLQQIYEWMYPCWAHAVNHQVNFSQHCRDKYTKKAYVNKHLSEYLQSSCIIEKMKSQTELQQGEEIMRFQLLLITQHQETIITRDKEGYLSHWYHREGIIDVYFGVVRWQIRSEMRGQFLVLLYKSSMR